MRNLLSTAEKSVTCDTKTGHVPRPDQDRIATARGVQPRRIGPPGIYIMEFKYRV
jgi:hypothetical protein